MLFSSYLFNFKSIHIAYVIKITTREIIIPIVVMIPSLKIGTTLEKQKLRKPIAVVIEVRATGLPILRI